MSSPNTELTLANVRLHWGIFIPAFLISIFLLLPVFAMLLVLRIIDGLANQLSFQPVHSNSWTVLIVLIPELTLAVLALLATWFAYLKSEIRLTTKRLFFRTGLLARRQGELPLENVEAIFIVEPLIGRIFGFGTILVTGVGGVRFPLRYIGSPHVFHSKLQKAIADMKNPLSMSPEAPSGRPMDDSRYMPKG